jgi:hypothetical protein
MLSFDDMGTARLWHWHGTAGGNFFVLPDRGAGKKRRVRTSLSLQFADFEAPEVENAPVMPFNF